MSRKVSFAAFHCKSEAAMLASTVVQATKGEWALMCQISLAWKYSVFCRPAWCIRIMPRWEHSTEQLSNIEVIIIQLMMMYAGSTH